MKGLSKALRKGLERRNYLNLQRRGKKSQSKGQSPENRSFTALPRKIVGDT